MFKKLKIKFILTNISIMFLVMSVVFTSIFITTSSSLERDSFVVLDRSLKSPMQNVDKTIGPKDANILTAVAKVSDSLNSIESISGQLSIEESIIIQVIEMNNTSGKIDNYRYLKYTDSSGTKIAFVDISYEISTKKILILNSLLIGLGAMICIYIISYILSNIFVEPVENAFSSQKQFISDASHELKTPLTVILASSKLLKDQLSNQQQIKWVENIECEGSRMKQLTDQLLYLTKTENSIISEHTKLNFSEIVLNEVLMIEVLFFEQNKEILYDIDGNIFTFGNSEQLGRLVSILLDNALKYSTDKSKVKISLKHDDKITLSISNNCDSIKEEELDKIFDRFYMHDKSRTNLNSYGLGLPIAKSIVDVHKGKIYAKFKDNIITIIVTLH